jgi:hypothetical protein
VATSRSSVAPRKAATRRTTAVLCKSQVGDYIVIRTPAQ